MYCVRYEYPSLGENSIPNIEFTEDFINFTRSPIGVLPDVWLWRPRTWSIPNIINYFLHILMDFLKLLPQILHHILFFSSNFGGLRSSVTFIFPSNNQICPYCVTVTDVLFYNLRGLIVCWSLWRVLWYDQTI